MARPSTDCMLTAGAGPSVGPTSLRPSLIVPFASGRHELALPAGCLHCPVAGRGSPAARCSAPRLAEANTLQSVGRGQPRAHYDQMLHGEGLAGKVWAAKVLECPRQPGRGGAGRNALGLSLGLVLNGHCETRP